MAQAPYALVRASLNGGAVQTGGITASGGQTCQLSADPAGLAGATNVLWEILDRPTAFALPSGWTLASDGYTYRYLGQTPPIFTLASAANFGKYIFRLTLNGGGPASTGRETAAQLEATSALVDVSTAVSVLSIDGIRGLAYWEKTQFSFRGWVADMKENLARLQTLITGAGGGAGTNNHSALSNLSSDDHTLYLPRSGVRGMLAALSMGGFKVTGLGTPTVATDAATKAYVDATSGFSPAGSPIDGYLVKSVGGTPTWAPSSAYSITAFAATTPVLEVGATATNPAFTAAHSATPTALLLTNTDNVESKNVLGTPTSFASSQSYTKTGNNASVSFTITGSDGISPANRSTTIAWRPRVYWGTGVAGLNTEAAIEALTSSALQASRAGTHAANATGSLRIYWAAPASYGTPTFTVGGFSGGFSLVSATISVTNVNGVTQLYQLWVSDTPGLGNTTFVVS